MISEKNNIMITKIYPSWMLVYWFVHKIRRLTWNASLPSEFYHIWLRVEKPSSHLQWYQAEPWNKTICLPVKSCINLLVARTLGEFQRGVFIPIYKYLSVPLTLKGFTTPVSSPKYSLPLLSPLQSQQTHCMLQSETDL